MKTWIRELAVVLVAPGWRQWRARRVLAVALLGVGVVVPLTIVFAGVVRRRGWVALTLDRGFLAWLMVAFASALVARVVALALWFGAGDRSRDRTVAAAGALVVAAFPLGLGFVSVARARSDIAPVFTPTADDAPLFDTDATTTIAPPPTTPSSPSSPVTAAPDTVPPTTVEGRPTLVPGIGVTTTTTLPSSLPARPESGVDPVLIEDVHNVLLLGGDAGPDRQGLRTDTMMILSLHTPSGRASLISLPRDMTGLLFPPDSALGQRYPYGFTNLANAVYPIVSSDAELRGAYEEGDIQPGIVATAEAIGYSLDLTIHDYVLIDMEGFIDVIDSLGGVTVNVTKEIPMPGNVPGAKHDYPATIGPGTHDMDGTIALGYVRSRYADSDFQRTARQRALIAALARQVSFTDVVRNFGGITSSVGGTLRTSLTPDELTYMLGVIGGETAIVESVGLVPPLTSIKDPDFQRMAEVVGAVQLAIAQGHPSGY